MHYFEHSICMKRNYISAVIALLLVTACGGNQEKAAMEEKRSSKRGQCRGRGGRS